VHAQLVNFEARTGNFVAWLGLKRVKARAVLSGVLNMAKPKWAEGHNLEACGLYYQGFVSNYEEVFTQHRLCTVTSYGIRRSRTTAASSHVETTDKLELPETSNNEDQPSKKVGISSLHTDQCFPQHGMSALTSLQPDGFL
jgi:hypothetical protein